MRDLLAAQEEKLRPLFWEDERREAKIYRRLQEAFSLARLTESDLGPRVGYAFHNSALEKLELLYSRYFGAEAALVRPQIVSGTHALSLALEALVPKGGRLLLGTGLPYETLRPVIGVPEPSEGSLAAQGVEVVVAEGEELFADPGAVFDRVRPDVLFIQRSRGYGLGRSVSVEEMGRVAQLFSHLGVEVLVDNCYGEFVEPLEPTHVGASLAAGSLIKNPGGTLAPTGGYVVGRAGSVQKVADRLFGRALGRAPGPMPEGLRPYAQGLFLAPHLVCQAVQTGRLAASMFQSLGYPVDPLPEAPRTDIVLRIDLGSPERLRKAVAALQSHSPVDGHLHPEAAPLPGYEDPVLMAGGGFVPGATLELSADGPMRPPYSLFLQGGVSRAAAKEVILSMGESVGAREGGQAR